MIKKILLATFYYLDLLAYQGPEPGQPFDPEQSLVTPFQLIVRNGEWGLGFFTFKRPFKAKMSLSLSNSLSFAFTVSAKIAKYHIFQTLSVFCYWGGVLQNMYKANVIGFIKMHF